MVERLELPGRILIVEDDRSISLILRKAFEDAHEIITASDGEEGWRLFNAKRPDFVITDLMLPLVDGLTLVTRARRSWFGACVPILVLTASTREQVLLECFRRGADDFMLKPFSVNELRVRVSSIHLRQQVARDMNPLTRLPGNWVIKREVNQRIAEKRQFCLMAFDIDYFKAFNDSRGFDAGDEVIKLLAEILIDYSLLFSNHDLFVGHVGGDDFVALADADVVEPLAKFVHQRFAEGVRRYYSGSDLERGTVRIINRQGEAEEVPLLSVSIAVVSTDRPGLDDYRKLTEVAAEIKKAAKAIPGNSLFIDRRSTPYNE